MSPTAAAATSRSTTSAPGAAHVEERPGRRERRPPRRRRRQPRRQERLCHLRGDRKRLRVRRRSRRGALAQGLGTGADPRSALGHRDQSRWDQRLRRRLRKRTRSLAGGVRSRPRRRVQRRRGWGADSEVAGLRRGRRRCIRRRGEPGRLQRLRRERHGAGGPRRLAVQRRPGGRALAQVTRVRSWEPGARRDRPQPRRALGLHDGHGPRTDAGRGFPVRRRRGRRADAEVARVGRRGSVSVRDRDHARPGADRRVHRGAGRGGLRRAASTPPPRAIPTGP